MSEIANQYELYFFRHGETVVNTQPHLVGGRSNETPPTELGIRQAKQLGRTMLAKNIIPAGVFASPARRTREMARDSLAEMGLEMEPIIQDELQELGQGPSEGRERSEIYPPAVQREIARLGKDFKLDGGESMNEVGDRGYGWMVETFDSPNSVYEPGRYFVYTHGGLIKYLASYIEGWPHQRTYETEIDNASVNLFVGNDHQWSVAYLNRAAESL